MEPQNPQKSVGNGWRDSGTEEWSRKYLRWTIYNNVRLLLVRFVGYHTERKTSDSCKLHKYISVIQNHNLQNSDWMNLKKLFLNKTCNSYGFSLSGETSKRKKSTLKNIVAA